MENEEVKTVNVVPPATQDPPEVAASALSNEPPTSRQPEEGFYPLDPGYIPAERIAGLIVFGILAVGVLIGLLAKFFHGGLDQVWFVLLAVALAVLALQFWWSVFWPPIAYRHIRWRLDPVGLEIHRGVIWKHRTAIPLARVQHADVSQGPLQRSYNLGTLTIHTAGTVGASVDLSGLSHHVALDLRDRLVRQRKADQHAAS